MPNRSFSTNFQSDNSHNDSPAICAGYQTSKYSILAAIILFTETWINYFFIAMCRCSRRSLVWHSNHLTAVIGFPLLEYQLYFTTHKVYIPLSAVVDVVRQQRFQFYDRVCAPRARVQIVRSLLVQWISSLFYAIVLCFHKDYNTFFEFILLRA